MRATVALARAAGVAVGAHPGFADRASFGRRELTLTPQEIHALVCGQVRALQAMADVVHVKPHGALYNLAARDEGVAEAVADAVHACDEQLVLVALAGSALERAGKRAGLPVASEGFVDRAYGPDGYLVARTSPGALLDDPQAALSQALDLVLRGGVHATDGRWIPLQVDTLCVHGDAAQAVPLAQAIHLGLRAAHVELRPLARAVRG